MDKQCGWTIGPQQCFRRDGHPGEHQLHDEHDKWIPPQPSAPSGWASTDDCGERREPARMEHHANRTWIRRGNHIVDLPIRASDESLAFGRDLCTAHNAYFCADPAEEAKLDRELGQALKADAEKRARRAAVAICDALGPKPPSMIVLDLVASLILACQR